MFSWVEMAAFRTCVLLWVFVGARAEKTIFDSDSLTVVDPSTVNNAADYADPASCGSKLYSMAAEKDKNMAVNIRVADFNKGGADYFRAHPSVTLCLQRVFSKVYEVTREKLKIDIGYEKISATSGYTPDDKKNYLSSGCGAVISYRTSGVISEITNAALSLCPVIFEQNQRDIGIYVDSSSVFLFMTGDITSTPVYQGGGLTLTSAQALVNKGLVPKRIPDCSKFPTVTSGSHYPAGKSDPSSVVGVVDEAVLPSMDTDVRRLAQYIGTDVDFTGCMAYPGNGLSNRCPIRVMSPRLFNVLLNLKAYTNKVDLGGTGGKITVEEAWNEGSDPDSLRAEGRMIKVKLSSGNNAANLEKLSRLAICAKADHVSNMGTYIVISSKKMKGRTESSINFPRATLVSVEPPASKTEMYALPTEMADEEDQYPLFDSNGRLDLIVSQGATLSKFIAKDTQFRYLRLAPAIAQCYSKLVYNENKWLNASDPPVDIEIVRAFMSNEEQKSLIQSSDERYNTHTLGQALELRYASTVVNGTTVYNNVRLIKKVVDICGPVFNTYGFNMNLGLYPTSVYVSMDEDQFLFWSNSESLIPQGYTEQTFDLYLEARRESALQSRIVDPDDITEACTDPDVPQRQHINYKYKEPKVIQRKKRRRRQTADACIPSDVTDFCTSTLKNREVVVEELWTLLSKNKHIYHEPESEVEEALKGCLLACGTCLEGSIYEKKLEHCSNLIHWMPFDLMNNQKDMTNFFARDNIETFALACEGSGHCLLRAPIFSILAPSVKLRYRPDPDRSVIEDLYSSEENPSPLLSLLEELYAISATGITKFWVKDEKEISSMKLALRAALMYNPDVSEVHVYVTKANSKSPVQGEVEKYVKEFAQSGCPSYTREILAPFRILDPPHSVRKRSAFNLRKESEEIMTASLRREMDDFAKEAP
ncbi:uncharacterized protein LOC125672258 isoform X1 [Ostrea edulis]|uniref:uncharacterized protein LOC125672258 isoform X1 n=1 Tax=Ostrea edulis TaxID=37623 RepID=UPI0020956D10|nr:uncharacterized protein LOC125672258 isoform X1 [Ostrea edulis]